MTAEEQLNDYEHSRECKDFSFDTHTHRCNAGDTATVIRAAPGGNYYYAGSLVTIVIRGIRGQ